MQFLLKRTRLLLGSAVLFLVIPFFVFAQEKISSFDVDITVRKDATAVIEETIIYDFGTEHKHGIYREIPMVFHDTSGTRHTLLFNDVLVLDEHGQRYQVETSHTGDIFRVRIGDPDTTVTGVHTYKISYAVKDAIAYLEDRDELYWNVTGNEWTVPIDYVRATVRFEGVGREQVVDAACYEGVRGANSRCDSIVSNEEIDVAYVFSTNRTLWQGEGLTIAVGIVKGVLAPRAVSEGALVKWWRKYAHLIDYVMAVSVAVVVFAYMYRRWLRYGKDARGRGVIVPMYEPPPDLSLSESAMILAPQAVLTRMVKRRQSIPAAILALAIKGAVRIEEEQKTVLGVFPKKDYKLLHSTPHEKLTFLEEKLTTALFSEEVGGHAGVLLLSEVKPRPLQVLLSKFQEDTGESLALKNIFTRNPASFNESWALGGFVLLSSILVLFLFLSFNVLDIPAPTKTFFAVVGFPLVLYIIFEIFVMPQLTQKGIGMYEHLLGLRRYIEVAEKDRIEFHNAPEKTPALFEKLLPYALLFGLTDIWVKEFEGILTQPPSWYTSTSGSWNIAAFSSDLSGFGSSFTSASTPASSGGGSSGGGGGGGGGGSW